MGPCEFLGRLFVRPRIHPALSATAAADKPRHVPALRIQTMADRGARFHQFSHGFRYVFTGALMCLAPHVVVPQILLLSWPLCS